MSSPLQDLLTHQDIVLIGLIAHLSDSPLQDDIAEMGQQLIGLGGNASKLKSGIPFLRKIPGLGRLLGSENTQGEKRELLVIIRPHIVSSEDEARLVSDIQLRKHPNAVDAGAINPDILEFDL